MHFRRQDDQLAQVPTTGIQLGDPSQGIDLILPLSISQCDHFLVFYNVTLTSDTASTRDAVIEFGNVGESRVFFTLKPPEGAGYLDWVCDIPSGRSFTARNGGREYQYTVDAGSSGCLGIRTTTSFEYAAYSVPIFTSYTGHRNPSTTTASPLEPSLTTVDFPTDPGFSTISLPTGVFVEPTRLTKQNMAVHRAVIAAYVVGALLVLLLPICCYRNLFRRLYSRIVRSRRRSKPLAESPSSGTIESKPPYVPNPRPIIPGPPPTGIIPQSEFPPAMAPPLPPASTPPAQPQILPSTPFPPTRPAIASTPRTSDLTTATQAPSQPRSSSGASVPTVPPKPNAASGNPPATTRPRTSSIPPAVVAPPISDRKHVRARSSSQPTPRSRHPNPDELAAIDVLASLSPTQKTTILESQSKLLHQPSSTASPRGTDVPPRPYRISQIRLPNATTAQMAAMKILNNQRDLDQRKNLIAALLQHKNSNTPNPRSTSLVDLPLPPLSQVVSQQSLASSAGRSSEADELRAIDLLLVMNPSRRSGFFASALRQSGGSSVGQAYGASPSPRINRQLLSLEKVAVAEVLEGMSVDQRRLLVADVLKRGSRMSQSTGSVNTQGYDV